MLARRVILSLLFNEGVLFRTKRFVPDYRYTQAFSWSGDADQLMLIDITRGGPWPGFPKLVEDYLRRGVDIPVTAGGHVRSWTYAKTLLNAGAEGVVVGWQGRDCYEEIAAQAGCQALTAGIDHGQHDRGVASVDEACREAVARGAGEILLTSIDRDGSLSGFDLPALQIAVHSVRVPIVVAGGCGSWSHMQTAFEAGAQGAATSNIFHLNATAMRSCKQWLAVHYSGPIRPAEAA